MKRLILVFLLLLIFLTGKAQTDSIPSSSNDSISVRTVELMSELVTMKMEQNLSERYKIYPTENIYILIKLDTQTGMLELIQ